MSEIIEKAAGVKAASPTPTPTRAMNRCPKLRAIPHSAVATLQHATATANNPTSEVRTIGEPCDGNSQEGVEHRKRETAHQAEFGIADVQVAADRADHEEKRLPVDVRQRVGERENTDGVPATQRAHLEA